MANFKVKNGLSVGTRYLQTGGTETAGVTYVSIDQGQYTGNSFDFSSQDSQTYDIYIKPDGTKAYTIGAIGDAVYQYSLSTAWDISTASYDSVSFSVSSQGSQPDGLIFKPDGTAMYVSDITNDAIYQYTLSTAWDISTASYASKSLSVSSQATNPRSFYIKTDGTKLYVNDGGNDTIYQYSLSTAWDVSTGSYDSVSLSITSTDSIPTGLSFNSDGTRMYHAGYENDAVYLYTLSTAWDISTATYTGSSLSVITQVSNPYDLYIDTDVRHIYVLGSNVVYEYSTQALTQTLDLSTGTYFSFTPSGATTVSFTNAPASGKAIGFSVEINGDGSAITWPSSVKWSGGVAPVASASKELYALVTTDGGTTYYGRKAAEELA